MKLLPALAEGDEKAPVFRHTLPAFSNQFRVSARRLGISKIVPYQARHSGASEDMARKARDNKEIKKRGGWSQDSSLRRYENAAQLSRAPATLSAQQLAVFHTAELELEDLFHGKIKPRDLALCVDSRVAQSTRSSR